MTWSHRRLVPTNLKVMSGHFPVFRMENWSPKPYAPSVHFKRHVDKVKNFTQQNLNRSSHKAKKPYGRSFAHLGEVDICRSFWHHGRNKSLCSPASQLFNFRGRWNSYNMVTWVCITLHVFQRTGSFSLVWAMFPKSRSPPLRIIGNLFYWAEPLFDLHHRLLLLLRILPVLLRNVQTTQARWIVSKNIWVSLNSVGRPGQYRIEASTADQLAPHPWVSFSILNDRLKCDKLCWIFNKRWWWIKHRWTHHVTMFMLCMAWSVYQPLCINHVGVHKLILLVRNPPHLVRRNPCLQSNTQLSDTQPLVLDPVNVIQWLWCEDRRLGRSRGPTVVSSRSSSPTSAGAQLGSAVQPHEYGGLTVQSTYFRNSKLPAILTSFYIAGETILEVPHPRFPQ